MAKKLAIALILLSTATGFTLAPRAYSLWVDPLARFRYSLEEGGDYAKVLSQFEGFCASHPESTLNYGYTLHHLLKGPVPKVRYAFLYRRNRFHDLYLQVLFNSQDRVQEVAFLVD